MPAHGARASQGRKSLPWSRTSRQHDQFEALTTDRQHPDYAAFCYEEHMRWTGHYVLLYADGEDTPAETGFWGDSGD
ncbi:MAG TPA: hypothetical protein VF060_26875 [Trebonia sp.]